MTIWRWAFLLSGLCAGLIGLMRLAPPEAAASALTRNPCALPCFFGVIPGETSRDQAGEVLAQYDIQPTVVSDYLMTFPLVDPDGRLINVSIYFGADGLVDTVRVFASDLFAQVGRVGDLLLAGQVPHRLFRTCNQVFPGRYMMTFGQYDQVLVELLPSGNLAPNTPIVTLDIATVGSRSLYDARASFGCTVNSVWRGFAAAWKYRFAPIE